MVTLSLQEETCVLNIRIKYTRQVPTGQEMALNENEITLDSVLPSLGPKC